MDQRKTTQQQREKHPTVRRQVNKADKNENFSHSDTTGDSTINDRRPTIADKMREVTDKLNKISTNQPIKYNPQTPDNDILEVPKEYIPILETVIEFIELEKTENQHQHYLDLCYKIKCMTRTLTNDNKVKKEINQLDPEILYPLATYYVNGKRIYLTRKDVEILLDYPFVITVQLMIITLNEMKALTKKGLEIYYGIVYPWKILTTPEWKEREKELMYNYWKYNKTAYTKNEFKNLIAQRIQSGKFKKELIEIRKRIEKNHS